MPKRISLGGCAALATWAGQLLTAALPMSAQAQAVPTSQADRAAPGLRTLGPSAPNSTPDSAPALPAGARSITLTEAELNDALAQRFPLQRSLHGLVQLSLSQPRVQLVPSAQRLRTRVRLRVAEPFTGQAHEGDVQLLHGLRFEASDRSLRMTGVQVEQLSFPSVPEPYRRMLLEQAPPLLAQALAEQPLYTAKPEQTALLDGLGFAIGALQVTPQGLRVVLTPALMAPPAETPARP